MAASIAIARTSNFFIVALLADSPRSFSEPPLRTYYLPVRIALLGYTMFQKVDALLELH
jgi:hypothetical protein